MHWLFFALFAPAIYSIVNFIDKYLLERRIRDYRGMPIFASIMGFLFGSIIWIGTGFPYLSMIDTLIIITTGIFTIWGAAFYFKALSIEHTSVVILFMQATAVITLVLSSIFLQEKITFTQFVGFFFVLLAVVGVSFKKNIADITISSSLLFMLLADTLWAISYIFFKLVVNANSFISVVSYESFGIALGGILLYFIFPSTRNAFLKTMRGASISTISILFINEAIFIVGKLLFFLAVSLGSVSLVTVLSGTQVFFGIGYGLLLTLLFPKIFKEDITKGGTLRKIIFAFVLFVGLVFIG